MSSSAIPIWVGVHRSGWVFVFDPELQLPEDVRIEDEINIYLVDEGTARAISPSLIRSHVTSLTGGARDAAVSQYLGWKEVHSKAFLEMISLINAGLVRGGKARLAKLARQMELQRAKDRAAKDELLAAIAGRHLRRIESLGIEYKSTRPATRQRGVRVTHC